MRDLELLDADLLGAAPDWARQLSPGASDHFNAKVSALYKEGKTPDQVDRIMATYGPAFFEDLARPKAPAAARAVRAAGGAAMAAKGCGADGDAQAWLLFAVCMLVLFVAWCALQAWRGPGDRAP